MRPSFRLLLVPLTALTVSACSDDPDQVAFEQQKELLEIQLQHELAMAKLQATPNVGASYEADLPIIYREVTEDISNTPSPSPNSPLNESDRDDSSSGYSGGDLLLASAAGAIAGYAVNEALDSGYRMGKSSDGTTRYYNSSGVEISKQDYETHKRENPIKSKANELTSRARTATATAIGKGKSKASDVKHKVVKSKLFQKTKSYVDKKKTSIKEQVIRRK